MNVLTIVSPGLKVLFERVGKPEVINRPEVLRLSGTAAVIACYQGPNDVRIAHFVQRPRVRVTFGTPIPTAGLPLGKQTTMALTRQLQVAIGELRLIATVECSDA